MKKTVKILIFLFILFLISNMEVKAKGEYSYENFHSCISTTCTALCAYENKIDNDSTYSVYISYDLDSSSYYIKWYDKNSINTGGKNFVSLDNENIHMDMKNDLTKTGKCPDYAFVDTGNNGEVCFSNNDDNSNDITCKKSLNNKNRKFEGTSTKTYDWLEEYTKNPSMDLLHGKAEPQFMKNNTEYNKIKESTGSSEISNSQNSSESNENTKPDGYGILPQDEESQTVEENPTEENVLGPLKGNLDKILNLISYLGPVLVVVLSSIEYLKAALNSDHDGLKKANSRFIKRLIAAVALFFVKPIVYTIINLIG